MSTRSSSAEASEGSEPDGGVSRIPTEPVVEKRVDLPTESAGFSTPPCKVQLKFLPEDDHWTVVATTPPAKPPKVAQWLEDYDPVSIHIAPGLSPKVLRANFEELPDAWEEILATADVRFIELNPGGAASVFLEDTAARIEELIDHLEEATDDVRDREMQAGPRQAGVTARQQEILSLAVAHGYYEIPHNLTLRDLAEKLDLSVGTVSQLLRRAEARIITSYVDALAESRWERESIQESIETLDVAPSEV
jgi:DNA-binding CsgD family transcriptional regulator